MTIHTLSNWRSYSVNTKGIWCLDCVPLKPSRERKKAVADSNFFGNVARNRKDNRIEDTVIIISIENEAYQTLDWSFGGFRIGGYKSNIHDNTEFMVNGIGPDLKTIFDVRVDCQAVRVTDGQLSASFIEIDSDVFDILQALMLRREKPLEKLKNRLSQTKGAQTDRPILPPPRHIPTLPGREVPAGVDFRLLRGAESGPNPNYS